MAKTSYTSILARSALISVFLATSAVAQSWIGSAPQTQVNISVVNVANGNGVFVPAVWVEDAYGKRTQVLMGQEGLTRAILYNQDALVAWVLARGEYTNPKVIFDDRSGDKDTQNPTPEPTPKPPVEEPEDDCLIRGSADVKTIDDLPIVLVNVDPCFTEKEIFPCESTGFSGADGQAVILRVQSVPCGILPAIPSDS
jgi:hypothetical protein